MAFLSEIPKDSYSYVSSDTLGDVGLPKVGLKAPARIVLPSDNDQASGTSSELPDLGLGDFHANALEEQRQLRTIQLLSQNDCIGAKILTIASCLELAALSDFTRECRESINKCAATTAMLVQAGVLEVFDGEYFRCTQEGDLIVSNLGLRSTFTLDMPVS